MQPSKSLKLVATILTILASYTLLSYANNSIHLSEWKIIDRALYSIFAISSFTFIQTNQSKFTLESLCAIIPIFASIALIMSMVTFWTLNVFDISLFSRHVIAYIYIAIIIPWSMIVKKVNSDDSDNDAKVS